MECCRRSASLWGKTELWPGGREGGLSNLIHLIKNSKQHAGFDGVLYNWMPVIGWSRTNNAKPGRGGALVTAFDFEDVKNAPLTKYGEVSREKLWKNLEYFLKAVVPEA